MTRCLAPLALLILALLTSAPLHAACVNPAGPEGEAMYNADYHVMQFCNGTKWISMAASGMGTEVDPKVGTLTNGKWCNTNGSIITCTQDAPSSAGGSAGQVQFNTGSALGGDGALYWDNTAKALGIGTSGPSSKAVLDLTSTSKGFLPPRMTTTQRDAISSPEAGLVIYNTTTTSVEVYNGSSWGSVGASIPNGTIAAFAAATCPTGWTEYTAARGRFLRGIDNGAGNDPDGTRSPGAVQADMFKNHSHGLRAQNTGGSQSAWSMWNGNIGNGSELATSGTFDTGGTETRPKNVAVIFCSYSGGGGGGGGGSTTLGGLTDVNVSGVANGQALVYNTATSKWIPGTATAGASGTSGLVQFSNGTTLSSDTALFWDNSGKKLGIGTASPSTALHVVGTATATTFSGAHSGDGSALTNLSATNLASGTVPTARLGSGSASSSTYLRGDGAWAAAGGGALSALSDVTLTSPANGNVLAYNGTRWVNVGAGSAMGTTTMVVNWPDAILCNGTGGQAGVVFPFYIYIKSSSSAGYRSPFNNTGDAYLVYNSSGAYSSSSTNGWSMDCVSSSMSISSLYSSGQAFNFIGSSLASAAAPAGGVQFNNGSGVLAADTALVWDNTNKRLGIGSASPQSKLDVAGTLNATGAATLGSTLAVTGNVTLSGTGNSVGTITSGTWNAGAVTSSAAAHTATAFIPSGSTVPTNGLYLPAANNVALATNSTARVTVDSSGNVGMGTANPTATLDVRGTMRVFGARSGLSLGQTYGPATTDGFLVTYGRCDTAGCPLKISVQADTSSPPSTERAFGWAGNTGNYPGSIQLTIPIIKGEYYRVLCNDQTACTNGSTYGMGTIYFVPLGQ